MTVKSIFKTSIDFLAHIFIPNTCLHCGIDLSFDYNIPLCANCQAGLEPMPDLQCKRCGVILPDGGAHCYRCRGYKAGLYKCKIIRSSLVFNSQIRSVIHHFKYRQKTKLAPYLGGFLIDAFKRYSELHNCEIIFPVALSVKKLNMRGFNQATMIALELAKHTGIKFFDDVLVRKHYKKSQTELSREQRTENVKDAFSVVRPEIVKGKNILLIDDVSTTTATLEACAVALKIARASYVNALTIARE